MKLVEQRISDRRILKLIKQWLVSGVLYGNVLTISELGTSQGSVISPLLANIYLNTLDRLWEKYGLTHGILVRYADDTVIICKNKKSANHALNLLQYIMVKLDLKLHPVKTKIVSMWDGKEGFDFLGMHHRRMTTETRKGQLYKETYQYPSRKAMKKMKAEVKRNVNRRSLLVAKEEDLIKNLNPKITGWKNYYSTKEAAMKIADDFGISYDSRQKPSIRPKIREPTPEQKYQQEENHCYKVLSDYFHLLRKWEKQYAPQRTDEVWHPLFVEALQKKSYIEYLLDILLYDTPEEKKALVAEQRKEVMKLEQRIAGHTAEHDRGRSQRKSGLDR